MDFQERVEMVRLARQHRFNLPALGLGAETAERILRLGDDVLVALRLAELDQPGLVGKLALHALDRADLALELLALAHQVLRAAAVAPEIWRFGLAVQRGQSGFGLVGVKDAS
jgi:NAD(P)-dependent dehydrogenase (short-subunit alcohol dehydrogenase family)